MKTEIDFSIYSSPTKAFARVSGPWDVSPNLVHGDVVAFPSLPLTLQVESINTDMPNVVVFGLSEVVLENPVQAANLAEILEGDLGLFVDTFD